MIMVMISEAMRDVSGKPGTLEFHSKMIRTRKSLPVSNS